MIISKEEQKTTENDKRDIQNRRLGERGKKRGQPASWRLPGGATFFKGSLEKENRNRIFVPKTIKTVPPEKVQSRRGGLFIL